jgi:septum formation protein
VLASRSPQRRAILEQLGVAFEVQPVDVTEIAEGPAVVAAVENARRKALAGSSAAPGRAVLGVDTVVALGARLYGKPADRDGARRMLEALSGRSHRVVSAIALVGAPGADARGAAVASESTRVSFRPLDGGLLDWYLDSGEWRERAGAYAIQGRGAVLVRRIDGDYLNVVGLPAGALLDLWPGILTGAR